MKRYITSTLFCLAFLHHTDAQGNFYSQISSISQRSKFIDKNSMYGQNFYFVNRWVKGRLLMADNTIISNDSFLFNYEKIDHRLLVTTDLTNIYEIDRRDFKAVLFYLNDSAYVFKHINIVNDRDLFQEMVKGNGKYSLFRVTRTKYIRPTEMNSLSFYYSSGRFEDIQAYYVFFPDQGYKTIFTLKKAAIQKMFSEAPADLEKVVNYLNANNKKLYEEKDLVQLILYLNG